MRFTVNESEGRGKLAVHRRLGNEEDHRKSTSFLDGFSAVERGVAAISVTILTGFLQISIAFPFFMRA